MTGGYGNSPWGQGWGGLDSELSGDSGQEERLPTTALWTQFDLRGVRQPNDMDRVLDFVETAGYGASSQFFINSFNLASGGLYPATPAILDMGVPVTETFTVEYRLAANQLPDDFDDPVNRHILLTVNNASGACAALLLSHGGVAYTGAISFDGLGTISFDHLLDPSGATTTERHLVLLPGSDTWFDEGQDIYLRFIVDWTNQIAYLYVTPTVSIVPGSGGTDSAGHVLRALLPVLQSATATTPPIDRVAVSVRGAALDEANLELFHYNLTSRMLVPNLPPRALAGADQAARLCSIVQLDGTGSFDPEGEQLLYNWRLIDAPITSQFVGVADDGYTTPEAVPTGFTDQLFSQELGVVHGLSAIVAGDVLHVGGVAYTIVSVKPDSTPGDFYVLVESPQIPDDLAGTSLKILRNVGLNGADTAKPTFYPDVAGFYLFDLRVFDGMQWSTPTGLQRAVTVVNVLESPLPRGCTPDLSFVFDCLPDFWKLVEDSDKLAVFWGALAQSVATELYTLWQYEYSKSVRDIQRSIIRRWLHYDLVLGEPLPELTKTFPVWSGVTTSAFSALHVNNRRFVITSPVFEGERSVVFSGIDPVVPEAFAAGFARELQRLQESFKVDVITLASGDQQLRVSAGFPFTVSAQSSSPFIAGTTNGPITGVGEVVAQRTVKVDRSLQGLELVEAFLVVDGHAYTIDRIVSAVGDAYPFQRVVVRRDPMESALQGTKNFVIAGWVSSELLDFYNGLVTAGDHVDFEVLDAAGVLAGTAQVALLVATTAYGASATFPTRLPVDFTALGRYILDPSLTVRLARVLRRGRLPVDDLVQDVPVLQEEVVVTDDTATLRRNLDFFIEVFRGHNSIRFVSGQGGGPDVFEGARPPFRLWAEYTFVDNSPAIEGNFGLLVDLRAEEVAALPGSVDYLSAVSGLMYAYTNGPTMRNIRIGTQILLGLPFAEEEGTIEELREDLLSDNGRILVRDTENPEIVRSYIYPKVLELEVNPQTGQPYEVGDAVGRFAPLVTGVDVIDYVKDPTWFQGIVNQGVFVEVQKYHTFVVRVDVEAFDLNALLFVQRFVQRIKPTYTQPRFIVSLSASETDGDEVSVNDLIVRRGILTLEDGICSIFGGSYVFDDAWAGGGQIWAGDSGNGHNSPYRNRFDHDDDPSTSPVHPVSEAVMWGFDKGTLLCPTDDVYAEFCKVFGAPFTPTFDSVFRFDDTVSEKYEGTTAGPVTIPSGATGRVLTLVDNTVASAGTLTLLRVALLGIFAGTSTAYEAIVNVNGAPDEYVVAFTAGGANQELLLSLSVPVVPGDTVQVRLRTAAQIADTPGWTSVLAHLSNSFPWTFDDTLAAGEYCGTRSLL